MGALTEVEIFDRLKQSFGEAAACCDALAKLPLKGPTYKKLREHLKLLEGAARQAGHWREDSRWFNIGRQMEKVHQAAGDFLRHHYPSACFLQLGMMLRQLAHVAERTRTERTGLRGAILPQPIAADRDTRPVYVSPGGILLPNAAAVH